MELNEIYKELSNVQEDSQRIVDRVGLGRGIFYRSFNNDRDKMNEILQKHDNGENNADNLSIMLLTDIVGIPYEALTINGENREIREFRPVPYDKLPKDNKISERIDLMLKEEIKKFTKDHSYSWQI